jgi:hypothetical protein
MANEGSIPRELNVFKRMRLYKNKESNNSLLAIQIGSIEDRAILAEHLEVDLGNILLKNALTTDFLVLSAGGLALYTDKTFLSMYKEV